MSGTTSYYNGILMQDCEIVDWVQIIEYDESQTDVRFSKFRITLASTLVSIMPLKTSATIDYSLKHPSTIDENPGVDDTFSSMPDRLAAIQMRLQEPRKDFWVAFHGTANLNNTDAAKPVSSPTVKQEFRLVLAATGIVPELQTEEFGQTFSEFVKNINDVNLDIKRADIIDCNNGPKPSQLSVKQVYGGQVLRVEITIECCRVLGRRRDSGDEYTSNEPTYDAQKAVGIISNRWSVTDSSDNAGAITHIIDGKITVRDQRYKAMNMRRYAFPFPFAFGRITNRSHQVDPTGLVLAYHFEITHAGAAPPAGVRDYQATYTESIGMGKKPTQNGYMDIKVLGWHDLHTVEGGNIVRYTEKQQKLLLLRGAFTILHSRVRGLNAKWNPFPGQAAKFTTLDHCTVIEKVGRPELTLKVAVLYKSDQSEFSLRLQNMGEPIDIPDYDPRWWPVDSIFGISMHDASDNPWFHADIHENSDEGDADKSAYFVSYFQLPDAHRHTLPRLQTDNFALDSNLWTTKSREWARANGFVQSGATSSDTVQSPSVQPSWSKQSNPLSVDPQYPVLNAIENRDLEGELTMGPLPIRTDADRTLGDTDSYTGTSDIQRSGFAYFTWQAEVMHDADEGKVLVPLSKAREMPASMLPPSFSGSNKPKQTAVAVQLHAGISKRVYSVTAERIGKWPEVPEPLRTVFRSSGNVYSGSPVPIEQDEFLIVETLLKKEVLTETPELMADGCTRKFVSHVRWTYGLSRPWGGSNDQGGWDNDFLPIGESPMDKATIENNQLRLKPITGGGTSNLSTLWDPNVDQYG